MGSTYAAILIISQVWHCYGLKETRCYMFRDNTSNMVLVTLSLVCCVLFAIFVGVMFGDQVWCIISGSGTIDSKSRDASSDKNELCRFLSEKELTSFERI